MRKIIKLNTHPYPASVWFTADEAAFMRKRTELTGREPEQMSIGWCAATDDRGSMVVGVFDGGVSTAVHELSHAAINVFHYVGLDVNLHTTEAFAYLLGSLFEQAAKHLEKQK